eukprot:TRINITY_DN8902_c0_g1_i2.p1 TRINITY_DN8902_c0_g1~~TRINITY_DN8902_c0_g1_i2.p1  ORF type:complete len:199 (+),score=30.08 TRINITY_DN8902_c0_g1_i2:108-704(+)
MSDFNSQKVYDYVWATLFLILFLVESFVAVTLLNDRSLHVQYMRATRRDYGQTQRLLQPRTSTGLTVANNTKMYPLFWAILYCIIRCGEFQLRLHSDYWFQVGDPRSNDPDSEPFHIRCMKGYMFAIPLGCCYFIISCLSRSLSMLVEIVADPVRYSMKSIGHINARFYFRIGDVAVATMVSTLPIVEAYLRERDYYV